MSAADDRHAGEHSGHGHESHSHRGHGHSHFQVGAETDSRRLTIALALIASFMAAEVVVGILAHSLALLADAAHMLTDVGALVMSLIVIRRFMVQHAGRPVEPSGVSVWFAMLSS